MRISRLVLWSIIILLLITNITTLFILSGKSNKGLVILDEASGDPTEPLAEVNQNTISYEDWQHELVTRYGESVLHDLIDKEVVFELAEQENFEVHPKIIDRELARMMIMHGVLSDEEKEKKIEEWTEQINYRYSLQ